MFFGSKTVLSSQLLIAMKVSDVSDSLKRNDDAANTSNSDKPVSQIGVSSGGDGSMKSTGRAAVSKSPIKSVSKTDISSGVVNPVRSRGATAGSQCLIQTHGKTGASSGPVIGGNGMNCPRTSIYRSVSRD